MVNSMSRKNISMTVMGDQEPILYPVEDRTVKENERLFIKLNATDPNNDSMTFGLNASGLPIDSISSLNFNSNSGEFFWTPTFNDSGNYSITFNVTDGNYTDSETINIMVLNTNRPPCLK